nr:hypothetical protein CFP56_43815 [Quercus suber]
MERDDNYSSHGRTIPRKAANGRTEKRRSRMAVQYEEVDVGSDDEYINDNAVGTSGAAAVKGRRAKPDYRRYRGGDEQAKQPFPDELPESFRDRNPAALKLRAPSAKATLGPTAGSTARKAAGKRPMMRPVRSTSVVDDAEDENVINVINRATNGDSSQVDDRYSSDGENAFRENGSPDVQAESNGQTAQRSGGRARNIKSLGTINNKQALINEENRLAKLQALEMIDDVYDQPSGNARIGSDDDFSSDTVGSDNESDNIPARKAAVAPV